MGERKDRGGHFQPGQGGQAEGFCQGGQGQGQGGQAEGYFQGGQGDGDGDRIWNSCDVL